MTENKIRKLLGDITKARKFPGEILGEHIGDGVFRNVYALKQDPRYVVKIDREPQSRSFCNALEFRNYIDHKEWTQLGPWLCPCVAITIDGYVMIQERAERDARKLPAKIPSLFVDKKRDNWGWARDGRPVCFDYPFLVLGEKFKLVRVTWRN